MLARLGQEVEITVTDRPRRRPAGEHFGLA
jgi:hypothetical protein